MFARANSIAHAELLSAVAGGVGPDSFIAAKKRRVVD